MQLEIAGVHHSDPLCRPRLHYWLQAHSQQYSEYPEFIAIEWDKAIFEQIRNQRPLLRKLAQAKWPRAKPSILDTLADAMGFEADTHAAVFPSLETVWLDQGRDVEFSSDLIRVAEMRLAIYSNHLRGNGSNFDAPALHQMSRALWSEAQALPDGGTERDSRFASMILQRSEQAKSPWAIVVVGVSHASNVPGSMVTRLIDANLSCKTIELKPESLED